LAEAEEMVRLCEDHGAILIVSRMRRWSSDYRLAKELISDGAIGEPASVVSHFSGNMIHTGTHAFDVLRYLFGDASWLQGSLEAFDSTKNLISQDTGGYALICFDKGLYATVHADSKGYFIFEFDIMGTDGRIRIGNRLFELYLAEESRTETGLIELYRKEIDLKENNLWIEAVKHLIACMEGKAENISGPSDGIAALEMAFAIHESHQNEGRVVGLPLENKTLRVMSR